MEEYYIPGKKGPQAVSERREEVTEHDPDRELDLLLGRPVLMTFRGVPDTPFCRIGDLARALNRSPGTIRKWQAAGILPPPSFGARTAALGGRVRLYSRDQIRYAREIAAEEGILNDPTAAVTQTNFKTRLAEVWTP